MSTDETTLLLSHLDGQRRHVLGILDGLDDAALRRPVLPTGWYGLGLVRHLTLDVERFWFEAVLAGDPSAIAGLDEIDNAWQVPEEMPAAAVLDGYRRQIERSNEVARATPIDARPAWWPGDQFGDFRLENLRDLLLHVLTETATHAGHLDAARELIDRRTWLILT